MKMIWKVAMVVLRGGTHNEKDEEERSGSYRYISWDER